MPGRGEGASHESIGSMSHRKALEESLVIRRTDIPLPSHPFNLVNIGKGKKLPSRLITRSIAIALKL